jgi:DNA repair exonuclease SbcCD nuclease subunit
VSDSQPSSPKPLLRALLLSDLLLDRPYEWAPPEVANERREAAREALVAILTLGRERQVDAIACAGDLYDRRTVQPTTMQWLAAALRSAGAPVLIAPGDRDYVGPLGGYTNREWPENVTVFEHDRFTPVEVGDGVTIWGAAHTQAHRVRSFLDSFEVDREGVNLALFHGAELGGAAREPTIDPCAQFDEMTVEAIGFDHALVGHYQRVHFGRVHTYPGAPIAHDFDTTPTGGVVFVTIASDGTIDREYVEIVSPDLRDVEIVVTGAKSASEIAKRVRSELRESNTPTRIRFTGSLSPDVVVRREDLAGVTPDRTYPLIEWAVTVDHDLDELTGEQTVRGQFARDILGIDLDDERKQRVLLIGLRALAGSDVLEAPR